MGKLKDKNDVAVTDLERLREGPAQQRLRKSADLYAQVYETDGETQEWADTELAAWPN